MLVMLLIPWVDLFSLVVVHPIYIAALQTSIQRAVRGDWVTERAFAATIWCERSWPYCVEELAMSISLSSETQDLIARRMKETGVATADELVRVALQTLDPVWGDDFEQLDPETQAAIEEGLAQADRGEGRPWEEVREELRARFIK